MKCLALVLTVVLFWVTFNQAAAENNLSIAASKLESDISNNLKIMGRDIESVAKETGKLGASKESEIRKLLPGLCSNRPETALSFLLITIGRLQ
jgi:hypothetical protein